MRVITLCTKIVLVAQSVELVILTSLGINATTDLQFFTAINSSGNVGIGTSSPSD
jgi:hypothetical protein